VQLFIPRLSLNLVLPENRAFCSYKAKCAEQMAGYSKLSRFMTEKHHPILRKYQSVAMRDLLYLQAELCHLEHCYEKQAQMDASETTERNRYNRDWFSLSTSARRDFGGKQWELAIQLREKLREYCMRKFSFASNSRFF